MSATEFSLLTQRGDVDGELWYRIDLIPVILREKGRNSQFLSFKYSNYKVEREKIKVKPNEGNYRNAADDIGKQKKWN